MFKVVYIDDNRERNDLITKTGGTNTCPPGWREITSEEFVKDAATHDLPLFIEYRQLHRDCNGNTLPEVIPVTLYHLFDGTGWAMHRVFWGDNPGIKYYRFGCNHKYKTVYDGPTGRCLHTYECQTCGYRMTVDSSD